MSLQLTPGHALFLDFDGTLVDIADHPDGVQVPAGLVAALQAVSTRLGGALAVLSGRSIATLDRFLAPVALAAAGLHGAELRLPDGRALRTPPRLHVVADALRARFGGEPGLYVEDKGGAVAVHFRRAPERGAEVEAAMRDIAAHLPDVMLQFGKLVVEIRPAGSNKGLALAELMEVPPFSGRKPVFIGDDATDEDGIEAAQALGGIGVKVGEGASAARHRMPDAYAVRAWLQRTAQGKH